MFKLNHTMPFTDEYNSLLKELFGDNLGEDSFVAAPISGACVSSIKIGKHAIVGAAAAAAKIMHFYNGRAYEKNGTCLKQVPFSANL